MTFKMSGWSAFYKTASGSGNIKCSNGQSMNVKLRARGGGLTVGKSTVDDGKGEFSGISGGISELLGTYVAAEAHAGAVNSAQANVMTKGEVSLALSGTGKGWISALPLGSCRSRSSPEPTPVGLEAPPELRRVLAVALSLRCGSAQERRTAVVRRSPGPENRRNPGVVAGTRPRA